MKNLSSLFLLVMVASCTTIHFRSNNTIPVTFDGNPKHQKEVSITGKRDFYFWGVEPEEHEVFVDEEVRKAGYDGMSKLIIYEQKNPQDILISFLTLGIYLPRGFTITGYTSGQMLPEDLDMDTVTPNKK
ncbi:hypothetical protein [Peredibacter starrii]|uniref:Lipoprotein n=1 Tax=Peredibacter starrii TaxID=28202 RepID=A0AAX4HT14_9BACT|nr:hypothetical protein [Peredibacter starrii]WPU66367.1 hypothetical protein SOO65_06380 [Peredibacter starrii]